jgi:hypothetical protein
MNLRDLLKDRPSDRLAERVTAAAYGTVLVLSSLALLKSDNVSSGLGWELVTGIGLATWAAHLFAEVVGDHVRKGAAVDRKELTHAVVDGVPILLATVPPAVILFLGRLDVLDASVALWIALIVAMLQLVGVGALAGAAVSTTRRGPWAYAAVTAIFGLAVVTIKVALTH